MSEISCGISSVRYVLLNVGKNVDKSITTFTKNEKSCNNPIPTGCSHVTIIYGLIPASAGRNRDKSVAKLLIVLKYIKQISQKKVGKFVKLSFMVCSWTLKF